MSLLSARLRVQLFNKFTSKQVFFDFDNWRAYCLDYTIFLNFFPNTVKLSIVPVALKICIQRDVFTQWDIHSYKQ